MQHNHSAPARRTRSPRSLRAAAGGFTLIESAMATVIIGVGVLAMIDAQQAFMTSNTWSSQAASATLLANEIRELTRGLPKHDPVVGLVTQTDGTTGAVTLIGWGPDAGEVTVDDFDDIDDFDGITFINTGTPGFNDGDLPGPLNAFGEVIPEIARDGTLLGGVVDDAFAGQAVDGWSQTVFVTKLDPFDTATTYTPATALPANGARPAVPVDGFPLLVTVEVRFQGPNMIEAQLVGEVSWIVP